MQASRPVLLHHKNRLRFIGHAAVGGLRCDGEVALALIVVKRVMFGHGLRPFAR